MPSKSSDSKKPQTVSKTEESKLDNKGVSAEVDKSVEPVEKKTTEETKTTKPSGNPRMASFGERLLALILDTIIVSVVSMFVYFVLFFIGGMFSALFFDNHGSLAGVLIGFTNLLVIVAFFAIFYVYYIYFYTKQGATLGKKIMKIKVVRTEDLQYMKWWQVLVRDLFGKWISGFFFYLGYFWYFMSEKRQALHDLIASTYAVKTDEQGNLLMDGPEKYEKKPLFTFGPVGCFAIFWILFFALFFGSMVALMSMFGNSHDKYNGRYDDNRYYQDDMGPGDMDYKNPYDDLFDNNGNSYDDLPNRRNPNQYNKPYNDSYGRYDNDTNEDLEKYLDDLLKDFENQN